MSYSRAFYEAQRSGSANSAAVVVPLILELVRPKSVVDVGCGVGPWLAAFRANGVSDVCGFDGAHVPAAMLQVPRDCFHAADVSQPLDAGRRFDLAVCLEVAEHLPADRAGTLIDSLVRLAPVVVFGAAIPLQGGTDHVNEQWHETWAERFAERGYVAVDALRPVIWNDDRVEDYYRQNTLVYVEERRLSEYRALAEARQRTNPLMLSVVHPRVFVGRNSYPLAPATHLLGWAIRLGLGRIKKVMARWRRFRIPRGGGDTPASH